MTEINDQWKTLQIILIIDKLCQSKKSCIKFDVCNGVQSQSSVRPGPRAADLRPLWLGVHMIEFIYLFTIFLIVLLFGFDPDLWPLGWPPSSQLILWRTEINICDQRIHLQRKQRHLQLFRLHSADLPCSFLPFLLTLLIILCLFSMAFVRFAIIFVHMQLICSCFLFITSTDDDE